MIPLVVFLTASIPNYRTEKPKEPKSIKYFNDPPATTKYGYISGYTGDDDDGHFYILALTCGYSLLRTSPSFDRILLIPTELNVPHHRMEELQRIWTHIIRRPYIQWPNGYVDKSMRDVYFWFKLNAWSVLGWEKLLWTGTDVIFRRDPSSIFDYPAPTSILDHYVYGLSHLGPVTNGDFFLFRPSLRDFAGLKRLGLDWARDPSNYGLKLMSTGNAWMGPHDQGLITQYFDGNITVAPQWYQLEVPGNPKSMLGYNNTEDSDPRIVSLHFPSLMKPWKKDVGNFSRAWSAVAHAAIEYLNETVNLTRLGFPPLSEVPPALRLSYERPRQAEPAVPVDNDDDIDPALLFPATLYRRRARARSIVFAVFALLTMLLMLISITDQKKKVSYRMLS